jgi:beta-1,4-mannosyltransferase
VVQDERVLVFFGLIRPYKHLLELVDVYRAGDPGFRLEVWGPVWPPEEEYAAELIRRARSIEGLSVKLGHLNEDDLDAVLGRCVGVVLPYAAESNSGAVFKALSCHRPVLVPRGPVTEQLADELGERWVVLYDPPLSAQALESFWQECGARPPTGAPDFSRRTWQSIGLAHQRAYLGAVQEGRRRRRTPRVGGIPRALQSLRRSIGGPGSG